MAPPTARSSSPAVSALVRVSLEDDRPLAERRPAIWVTTCPFDSRRVEGAIAAAGEAASMFVASLQREAPALEAWLWNADELARRAIDRLYKLDAEEYRVWRHELEPFELLRDLACAVLRVDPRVVDELRGELS